MKISYKALQKCISLTETPEEISKWLTATGLEVEGVEEIESIPGGLKGVVIGQVLSCEPHPDADRLKITKVDIGLSEPSQIVCGASNVAVGQKVVVATVGSTLYPTSGEPISIKKSKIRGVVSEGMICAEDEIGVGSSHAGILVLDTDLPNGTEASTYFHLTSDYCIEIGLTPNRADAASHMGVARDLRAVLKRPLLTHEIPSFDTTTSGSPISVVIEDDLACPRFCGAYLSGVQVQESPEWLKSFLRTIGVNSINNLVDISNYICHFYGQPMHIFDADRIGGQKIRVRVPEAGTTLVTLDGLSRTLTGNDLAICQADGKPLALAGIFGGQYSGVSEATQNVFLEVAYFDPAVIRKAATYHGLKTDASFRYERGTDPWLPPVAIRMAIQLIQEIAGGKLVGEIQDVAPRTIPARSIVLTKAHVDRLIGKKLSSAEIETILIALDIEVAEVTETGWVVHVPPYRVDVTREADVIEEILRIHGFDQLHLSPSLATSYLSDFPVHDADTLRWRVGETLVAQGFYEIQTLSIVKPTYNQAAKAWSKGDAVPLLNPLSEELSEMRQTLVFSGMESLAYNINRRQRDLAFFEFGRTYRQKTGEEGHVTYQDQAVLGLWMTGQTSAESWEKPGEATDYFALAARVQSVLHVLKIKNFTQVDADSSLFQYGMTWVVKQKPIVSLGKVLPSLAKLADVKQAVFYAEFDWAYLLKAYQSAVQFTEIPKFPEVRRDLSLVIDRSVRFQSLEELAFKTEKKLLKQVHVFDVYQGDKLDQDKKAYALSFILQDAGQTLTDQVIDKTMQRLIQAFEEKVNATIRK